MSCGHTNSVAGERDTYRQLLPRSLVQSDAGVPARTRTAGVAFPHAAAESIPHSSVGIGAEKRTFGPVFHLETAVDRGNCIPGRS